MEGDRFGEWVYTGCWDEELDTDGESFITLPHSVEIETHIGENGFEVRLALN